MGGILQEKVQQSVKEEAPPSYPDDHVNISAAFSTLNLSANKNDFPSEDECIAHLKLLEAFYYLKEDVVSKDGLFGIRDDAIPDGTSIETAGDILSRKREKRWAIFVVKAVQRFETWFQKQMEPSAPMFTMKQMAEKSYQNIAVNAQPLKMNADGLPPLGKFDSYRAL